MRNHFIRRSVRPTFGAITLASLALVGCATPTPYEPAVSSSNAATGYASQRLAEGRYRVSFAGNSLTSRETVENYLLYRAAELTKEQGYDGFVLIQRDTQRDVDTRIDRFGPGRYGYWGPSWRYYRGGRSVYWDPYFGDPFWGDSYDVRTIERYEAFAEISMFRGSRSNDPRAFDAGDVMRNLGPTIKLPG